MAFNLLNRKAGIVLYIIFIFFSFVLCVYMGNVIAIFLMEIILQSSYFLNTCTSNHLCNPFNTFTITVSNKFLFHVDEYFSG